MGDDLKEKILIQNGVISDLQAQKRPSVTHCARCSPINTIHSKYCSRCSYPLTLAAFEEIKADEQMKLQALQNKYENDMEAMRQEMERKSTIRWETKRDGDSDTLLTLTHSHLTKSTSSNFAPGWHAYLDRLEASLNNEVPPDWIRRFEELRKLYPSQLV